MDEALLIRVALSALRSKYQGANGTPDIAGLTAFRDQTVATAQASAVTITSSAFQGGSGAGQITFAREIWLIAAQELLDDPAFNWGAMPRRPRVVIPDFRFSQPV